MSPAQRPGPLVLCILDGWGLAAAGPDNAILSAKAPVWRRMLQNCAGTSLETSGEAVGLPYGQMGNSEVGHLTMGAGRILTQDLPRIDHAVADGSIAGCPAFRDLVTGLKQSGGRCHLMGLLSPGGVHSHQNHMAALANLLAKEGITVLVHAFLDGRDTPPSSARDDMARFAAASPQATIATVTGRYFAMDRDTRWDRIERAYDAIVAAKGTSTAPQPDTAIAQAYGAGQTDEFVEPVVIDGYDGMQAGDGLLMANFRADRARQLLNALLDPEFSGFSRGRVPEFTAVAGIVSYSSALDPFLPCLFEPQHVSRSLGSLVADAGLTQLRIAETEKYAHVTYFFNGGGETAFAGEDRILVPSPKVATYDLQPEMSAGEVTDNLVAAIKDRRFDLVICNFANPDMVGHTGIFAAALKAVETVDQCLGRIADAVTDAGGYLVVTADHGNIESMRDPATGVAHTAHTTNPVPLVIVNGPVDRALRTGGLADLAPTLLDLLKLPQPDEMTGHSLLLPRG